MADKDIHKVDSPKAPENYSSPNDLDELLKDLDSFENAGKDDLKFNSPTHDGIETEKHKPEDSLPEVLKETTDDKDLPLSNIRNDRGNQIDKEVRKELEKLHEEAPYSAINAIPEVKAILKRVMAALDDTKLPDVQTTTKELFADILDLEAVIKVANASIPGACKGGCGKPAQLPSTKSCGDKNCNNAIDEDYNFNNPTYEEQMYDAGRGHLLG